MKQLLLHLVAIALTFVCNAVAARITSDALIEIGLVWRTVIVLTISAIIGSFFHLMLNAYPVRDRLAIGAAVGIVCQIVILSKLPAPQF